MVEREALGCGSDVKVLQVVHEFRTRCGVGGTGIYTDNLSRELSKKHEVYVFYPVSDPTKKQYALEKKEYNGLRLLEINHCRSYRERLNPRFSYKNNKIAERFATLLDKIKPDIVHFQHLIDLSASLIPLCKQKGTPTVLHLHDFWFMCHRVHLLKGDSTTCSGPDEKGAQCLDCYFDSLIDDASNKFDLVGSFIKNNATRFVFKRILRAIYRGNSFLQRNVYLKDVLDKVDLIIAPSNFVRDKFVEYGLPDDRVFFLRHGMDTKLFTGFIKGKKEKVRFGFVGGLGPHKGAELLIEAFNKIKDENAELKIYGSYDSNSQRYKTVRAKCTNPNIKFMGRYEDVRMPFSEIDVLVVPSICYESGPLAIQEAFIAKTPVIASNIGALPELVIDSENGLLFRVGDAGNLRAKMEAIIENPGLIEKLGANIKPVKTMEAHAGQLEAIYNGLIECKSRTNYSNFQNSRNSSSMPL